ncbi:MAG TPA: precorrin-6Y C5,15-methyltransferase (decarboxylating) subunit CbiT [Nitrososphaeraceae archaeon]
MSIPDCIRKSQVKILDAIEYKHTLLWNYRTPGIPDELFERTEQVPITKEDVRALVLSKLRLKENSSAIDIGCGSGSITVELCLQTKDNKVYAIDFEEKATELTRKNLLKFGLKAEVILSKAQDILPTLPQVDAIIIGGTWGNIEQIIRLSIDKLKKGGRLVIDTILIETMYKALTTINEASLGEVDVTQVIIAKARKVTTGTMMLARNPVLIISATKP